MPESTRHEMRQCVILVGGAGTRLGEAVKDVPKPMLDVGGIPFVVHVIRYVARFGFDRFVLLAGYRGEVVREYFGRTDCPVPAGLLTTVLAEWEPLGTGGALRAAVDALDRRFLLVNGDSLCRCDVAALCRSFRHGGTIARMALRHVEHNDRYGGVDLDGDRIAAFCGRTVSGHSGFMNAGLYAVDKLILDFIPAGRISLEGDVFPRLAYEERLEWLDAGRVYFIDIGVPGDLQQARKDFNRAGCTQG